MSRLTTTPKFAAGEVRSPLRQGILSVLQKNGPSTMAEIGDALLHSSNGVAFSEGSVQRAVFRLRQLRLVHRITSPSGSIWFDHGPEPVTVIQAEPSEPEAQTVPPRQHSVLHGPLYVPKPTPALRPGAMDFRQIPSRGVRC